MATQKRKRKKNTSARRMRELAELIAVQQRRAIRPTLPVNTQTRISESLVQKQRKIERKQRQRREWEDL